MIELANVKKLVDEAINENPALFLIDLQILPDNKITVIVDGDNGINIKECIRISRHIESNLDREETDFSLEVTSPGATEALVNKRQYQKNIGKTLKVKTEDESIQGVLTVANEDDITVEWKVREPKPIGKGKITVVKKATLPYEKIKQAKVKIIF